MTSGNSFNKVSDDWLTYLAQTQELMTSLVSAFTAGRIVSHARFWRNLTSDYYVLKTVSEGKSIEFDDNAPIQQCTPRQYKFSELEHDIIVNEIQSLMNKGVILEVDHCEGEYLSNIFIRPKKDGRYRMILNLKRLNKSITYHHFKLSSLKSVINMMSPNCYMASIDWVDAYYCISIKKAAQKVA